MIDYENYYPSLWADSEDITALRKIAQKPFSRADYITFYSFRKFSIYLSKFIVDKSNISGNEVSYFMIAVAFIAPIMVMFLQSESAIIVAGFTFFYLIYFLDVVDGEVARIRGETSEFGRFLDVALWFLIDILYLTYLYTLLGSLGYGSIILALAFWAILTEKFYLYVVSDFEVDSKISRLFVDDESKLSHLVILAFVKFLLSKSGIYLIILVLSILDVSFLIPLWVVLNSTIILGLSLSKLLKIAGKMA
jgi:phosphatidylglycerophosphate synthase